MNRIEHFLRLLAFVAAATLCAAATAAPVPLLSSQDVLKRIEHPAADGVAVPAATSGAHQLLTDIQEFRAAAPTLAPAAAADRWFELLDRAAKVGDISTSGDLGVYDLATLQIVGQNSVLASLPPPPVWPALRKLAAQRATQAGGDRETLGLRLLTEILAGDRAAAGITLDAFDKLFGNLPPDERSQARVAASQMRSRLVRTYGTPDEIASAFQGEIASANASALSVVELPDLVSLIGEQRATALLLRALTGPATLQDANGDATRKLARKLALENIGQMRVAQWQLVDSVESGPLYEAIEKRFDPATAKAPAFDEDQATGGMANYLKGQASAWYFLGAVIDGKQHDAERALVMLSGESDVYIPHEAVQALRDAGQDEALFKFLNAQLEHRPQLRAWNLYITEAAFTGHSAEALALIQKVLLRKDLPEFLSADLRVRRADALLAGDRIEEASAGYRALFAKAPLRSESTLDARLEAAVKAAAVGRLTGQRDLADASLRFALAALQVAPEGERNSRLSDRKIEVWRELRKQGRAGEVQPLAVAELARADGRAGMQMISGNVTPVELAALAEIAGIWSEAGRHADVLRLVNESTRWGYADAGKLLATTDSRDTPFGVMLARALANSGDTAAALRVARATVSQLPGKDAVYQLLAELDPSAIATFDALFALDEYEERPLIWKATVQLKAGALDDAEKTVRRAIAIDPSDGEQGPNDRMRAYAVLSEILARKGDEAGRGTYAKAVSAIRLSEQTDEFHAAGMYERAFKGYRAALEQFSDAYCIQSRLAVQLYSQGRRTEALEHYRRAYELMPDSFGRVESHCFGCESVFQGSDAQSMAERVFNDVIHKTPAKPQAYYLLAYLRQQQERPADALQPLRQAVSLDPRYLNAWVHLYEIGEHTYIEPGELDIARLKLLELDPLQRHARYTLNSVGNLAGLWRGVERAAQNVAAAKAIRDDVYPLRATAAMLDKSRAALPPEMREQMALYERFAESQLSHAGYGAGPALVLDQHDFLKSVRELMGIEKERPY